MTRLGITSVSNARLKTIRRLRRRRGGDGVFLVEGYRAVLHALEARAPIRELYAAPPLFLGSGEARLVEQAEAAGACVYELGAEAFRSIAGRPRPDGLLALVGRFTTALGDLRVPRQPLVLVAEAIERPGNLGTIVRTACAAGVDALLLCDGSTGVFHPEAVQGSIGAVFRVPVAESSAERALTWLRARDTRIVVASPAAERHYWELDWRGAVAVVVGSERHGVSERFLAGADTTVRIPMGAGVDSLNVAVATGVILFEAVRQRAATATGSAAADEIARRTPVSSSRGLNGFRTSSASASGPSASGA